MILFFFGIFTLSIQDLHSPYPRGGLELTQVEELAKVINTVVFTQSPDSWSWTLNNSGGYTVASSRNCWKIWSSFSSPSSHNSFDVVTLGNQDVEILFKGHRVKSQPLKRYAHREVSPTELIRFAFTFRKVDLNNRRGIDIESLSCVNCDVGIETNDHLFFACNTAKKISKLEWILM
ncbi:hypothetical protein Tco_1014843 [Tanacetum coccineum]